MLWYTYVNGKDSYSERIKQMAQIKVLYDVPDGECCNGCDLAIYSARSNYKYCVLFNAILQEHGSYEYLRLLQCLEAEKG